MKATRLFIAIAALATLTSCDLKKAGEKLNTASADSTRTEAALAPDFTLYNPEGEAVSLSDYRGKMVVLDFWGSWCRFCIQGMPALKEFYNTHPNDFVLIGLDVRDDRQTWVQTIEEQELDWEHVQVTEADYKLLEDYHIEGFPTKIIIDPDGYIVDVTVGEDESFYEVLDEALN
ncbi:MAG: TlpA family protein disulfide reductase [Bacteroidaceae bacterium]|nr:TlpA family protein disulfide reductase [Bacteroidaceae bacterium]